MLLRLLEADYPLDEVIYFDIGVEFDAVKNNAEKMRVILQNKGIQFTVLKPKVSFLYTMLEKPVQKRNGEKQNGYKWCGGVCRWGTLLKLNAIKEHNRKYEGETIVEYVGVANDETHRINRRRDNSRIKIYPLIEWNMSEKDCLNYCYERGWNWQENGIELYDILDRVSCKYCRNKNIKELRNIYKYMPKIWQELRDLQTKIEMPFKNNASIFELEERFRKELSQQELF